MAIRTNATLTFQGYAIEDAGVMLRFVCLDPGAGQPTDYAVLLTDVELSAVTTQAQLRTLVIDKLNRKLRAALIATKLDPFVGQSLVI